MSLVMKFFLISSVNLPDVLGYVFYINMKKLSFSLEKVSNFSHKKLQMQNFRGNCRLGNQPGMEKP